MKNFLHNIEVTWWSYVLAVLFLIGSIVSYYQEGLENVTIYLLGFIAYMDVAKHMSLNKDLKDKVTDLEEQLKNKKKLH